MKTSQEQLILEYQLAELAAAWRSAQSTSNETQAAEVVDLYCRILTQLILSFPNSFESLDVDSELPDRLLPQIYLDHLAR